MSGRGFSRGGGGGGFRGGARGKSFWDAAVDETWNEQQVGEDAVSLMCFRK